MYSPLSDKALCSSEVDKMQTAARDRVSTRKLSTRCRAKALKFGNFKPNTFSAHSLINVDAAPNISSVMFSSECSP